MEITRGSIYWVKLDPTVGSEIKKERPCIVISVDPINQSRKTVVIIPLSSSAKEYNPITVAVKCEGKPSTAILDQIRAVDKSRISNKCHDLTSDELQKIEASLKVLCGL